MPYDSCLRSRTPPLQRAPSTKGVSSPDAGSQVFPACLTELGQEVHGALLLNNVHHLTKGAVWSQVGRDDGVLDSHGRINDCPIRNQAHTSDHGVELHQTGDLFPL